MSIKITTQHLPKGTIGEEYSCQLTADVSPPSEIIWRNMNELPNGLYLNPETGLISGTCEKTFKGTIGIEAESLTQNEKATKVLPLVVTESQPKYPPLKIITNELPSGIIDEPYTAKLIAEGGRPPYHWIARNLQDGLTIDVANGEISGIPTESANNIVCVTVKDSALKPTLQYKGFTLEVVSLPVINSFAANWISEKSNELELVWDAENAEEVHIEQLPSAIITGESHIITPSPEYPILSRYTLVISNAGGSVTYTIEVTSLENVDDSPITMANIPMPVAESYAASKVFVGYTQQGLVTLNSKTLSILTSLPLGPVWSIAASPDGLRVFLATQSYGVMVFDTLTLAEVPNSPIKESLPIQSILALSTKGSIAYLYVVSYSSSPILQVFNADTFEKISETELEYSPAGISISPDGERIYLPYGFTGNLSVLSSDTLMPVPGSPVTEELYDARCVQFSLDGSLVYVANCSGSSITILHASTLKPTDKSPVLLDPLGNGDLYAHPTGLAVSPDGLRIYTANSGTGSVTVLSSETLKGLTVDTLDRPMDICASCDGSRIYVTNNQSNTLSALRPIYGNIEGSPLV
ncbi:MAG: YncE family protein [Flavobacteriaceae bacterium]